MRSWLLLALVPLAGCPDPERECVDGWHEDFRTDEGALLSVQGTSIEDVWVAGGGLGLGGAILRHWDGAAWTSLPIDDDRTLWWVTPDREGGAWAVGERGLVVHVTGGAVEIVDVGVDEATLFGAWARAPDDVHVVGGIPDGQVQAEDDLVLHWDGESFTRVTVPARGAALFKVWGDGEVLFVSGQHGTMLHGPTTWTDRSDELDTNVSILTVHGCGATDVYAVGGQSMWEYRGSQWAPVNVPATSALNGVSCTPAGALVVGNGGLKLRLADDIWEDERLEGPWDVDFHSVWEDGHEWAAGGNFNSPDAEVRRGVLARNGCPLMQ